MAHGGLLVINSFRLFGNGYFSSIGSNGCGSSFGGGGGSGGGIINLFLENYSGEKRI